MFFLSDFHFRFSVYKSEMIFLNFYVPRSAWDLETKLHPPSLLSWPLIKICHYNEAKDFLDDVKRQNTISPDLSKTHYSAMPPVKVSYVSKAKGRAGRNRKSQNASHSPAQHSQAAQPLLCSRRKKLLYLVALLSVLESNPVWHQILHQSPSI